ASDPRAHVQLGKVLQEAGRFEEASATFERSIAISPWETSAYQGLVSSKKLSEADRPWVAQMLARLAAKDWRGRFAPAVVERHHMTLHFAIGKALDDLGDYADAMKHFDAANDIRARLAPFHRKETE